MLDRLIVRTLLLLSGLVLALHVTPVKAGAASYRDGAARHIYATYAASIYKGMLPPLVHAIVVVETEVDMRGNVRDVRVVRSPSHAPEVTDEVRQMIQRASPFPAPGSADGAKFVEVWLVDDSGRFQLHTLTEGQR